MKGPDNLGRPPKPLQLLHSKLCSRPLRRPAIMICPAGNSQDCHIRFRFYLPHDPFITAQMGIGQNSLVPQDAPTAIQWRNQSFYQRDSGKTGPPVLSKRPHSGNAMSRFQLDLAKLSGFTNLILLLSFWAEQRRALKGSRALSMMHRKKETPDPSTPMRNSPI